MGRRQQRSRGPAQPPRTLIDKVANRPTIFFNWNQDDTELIGYTFTGRLRNCVFYGVCRPIEGGLPRDNEFHDNDFADADLVKVEFRWGVDLSRQRLSAGPDYLYVPDLPAAVTRVGRAVRYWPQPQRKRADIPTEVLDRAVTLGQRQLFLRLSEWVTDDHDATFFQLLREAGDPSVLGDRRTD